MLDLGCMVHMLTIINCLGSSSPVARVIRPGLRPCIMQVTELEHRLRAADGGHAVAQEELTRLRSAAQVLRRAAAGLPCTLTA